MPVTVTVELLTGSYDAASTDDRAEAEWPPHPARLFCALVAAATGGADRTALTWLEAQTPPVVWAATDHDPRTRSAYVVTNTITAKPGSQSHVGRTNGLRARVHTVPASPRVRFVWEDAEADDGVV